MSTYDEALAAKRAFRDTVTGTFGIHGIGIGMRGREYVVVVHVDEALDVQGMPTIVAGVPVEYRVTAAPTIGSPDAQLKVRHPGFTRD